MTSAARKANNDFDFGMDIISAIEHPHVFASLFRDITEWAAWLTVLRVIFGLPLKPGDLELFQQCTGRQNPRGPYNEVWLCCGRRAGKSFILALIAVFSAVFKDYRKYLAPGERGTIMVIAADRKQARVILRYIRGMLDLPALRPLLQRETADSFDLANSITIEVATASYKTVRGYTIVVVLLDEISYWESGDFSSNPDNEIISALKPAMVTIPGAMMLVASNPHGKFGAMWEASERHHGKEDSPALFWKASTRTMHPSIPQEVVEDAIAIDPDRAQSEWMAEFRSDLAKFIDRLIVEGLVIPGRHELPFKRDVAYVGFADVSGGANDSFVFAIAHLVEHDNDETIAVLDVVREYRSPLMPENVVREVCDIARRYNIDTIVGDAYGKNWVFESFKNNDIKYEESELTKNEIYLNALPLLMQGRCELLDNKRLVEQVISLERKTSRAGRDSIAEPQRQGFHDDVANAALGALVLAAGEPRSSSWVWGHLS
jgi:hypothetical protein